MGSIRPDAMGRNAEISRPTEIFGRSTTLDGVSRPAIPSIRDAIVNPGGHKLLIDSLDMRHAGGPRVNEELVFQSGGHLTIRRVTLENPNGRGIVVRGPGIAVVEDTTVSSCRREGILVDGLGSPTLFGGGNVTLIGNNASREYPVGQITVRNGTGALITSCTIRGRGDDQLGQGLVVDRAGAIIVHLLSYAHRGGQLNANEAQLHISNFVLRDGLAGMILSGVDYLVAARGRVTGNEIGVVLLGPNDYMFRALSCAPDVSFGGNGRNLEADTLPLPDPVACAG